MVDGTGDKKEANGELDKSDCNGHNKTDETVVLGAKKASGGSRIVAFFGKMFKPRSDVVADKSATEDQTVVKMVEEGLEQTVVEETTPLAKEAEREDKYITSDKPELVEEDDIEGVYNLNLAGILKPNFWIGSRFCDEQVFLIRRLLFCNQTASVIQSG